jgi:hypothetical protein
MYSDFRNVGGWVMPFRTAIADELGDSELTVETVRFDEPLILDVFRAHRPAPRP